jgi:hypothetical protein
LSAQLLRVSCHDGVAAQRRLTVPVFFVFFASDRVPAPAAQKRALLDRNISSRTVSRKAEQAINDDKEHKVRLRPVFFCCSAAY